MLDYVAMSVYYNRNHNAPKSTTCFVTSQPVRCPAPKLLLSKDLLVNLNSDYATNLLSKFHESQL